MGKYACLSVLVSLAIFFAAVPLSASADEVVLENGRTLVGEVTSQEGGKVVLALENSTIELPVGQVLHLTLDDEGRKEYALRFGKIVGAEDAFALSGWCRQRNLFASARKALDKCLELDPDHRGAREFLGHFQTDRGWLTPDKMKADIVAAVKPVVAEGVYPALHVIEDYLDSVLAHASRIYDVPAPCANVPELRYCVLEVSELDKAWGAMSFQERLAFACAYGFAYCSRDLEGRKAEKAMWRSYEKADADDIDFCRTCGGKGKEDKTETCPKCKGSKKALCECPDCVGQGKIDCKNCIGTGFNPCPKCKGTGKVLCSDCHGSGKCSVCGGSGLIEKRRGVMSACTVCRGNGVCNVCNGTGREKCHDCDDGKIKCRHCTDGKVTCPKCKGKGFFNQSCDVCNGIGVVKKETVCPDCQGRGRWHRNPDFHKNQNPRPKPDGA
ncbi:MAG: hypothetical protein WC712_09775 [Candidatus Brocadiia bacterium]